MEFEKNFPFWKHLSEQEQVLVSSSCFSRKYQKGDLVRSGQDCLGLIMVQSGFLRVYIVSEEGREITLYRLYEYDVCLLTATCMMTNLQADTLIEAEEDSEILILPTSAYSKIQTENVHVANYTAELMASHFSEVMWLLDQILYKKMDGRLAAFLLEEKERGSGSIQMTHDEISRHLGTAREVVSRMLKYFEKDHLVELSRGTTRLLDEKRLYELAKDSLR